MSERTKVASRWLLGGLLTVLTVAVLALYGCGTKGYDTPTQPVSVTRQTPTALVDAATLKTWTDSGFINQNSSPVDKVVVLEVTTPAAYATAHIPGSLLLDSSNNVDLTMTRLEGIAPIGTMVPTGAVMDEIIQRSGIDSRTTVVFSVSKGGSFLNTARAYFTFRYWGFPKDRLKVLNGGDNAWEDAGNTLTAAATTVTRSSYSVRTTGLNSALRAPIGDMIKLVDDINLGAVSTTNVSIVDLRGGTITANIANAIVDDFNRYADFPGGVNTKTKMFPASSDLVTRLNAKGLTNARSMNYVYCASGMRASTLFLVLDGVLGWPVTLYDGSWGQWSAYVGANNVATIWKVDVVTPNTTFPRTTGTITAGTLALDPVSNALFSSVTDPRANQIKVEDTQYISTGTTSGGSTSGGSGSSSGDSGSGC
ncbi:hypothetical protein GMST_42390 [Geomonas silvestris]|uniref:Rhodanese domain-containing protein n=1 Tax=Geomonas silvestris TaxID=2740184 RepID=A0A6V8MPR4_9BACT|nr:selenite/tellurite reduction operon rhodanese-like protein ExtH [Geomonas silvestris]GFO61914.1 hypothetical protein GMST_42390 [Geomonas silvestris]